MKRVILESPYAGDIEANVAYARRCLLDSIRRGEAPIASHLLYPQVLDDSIPEDRTLGIKAGLAWRKVADYAAFYVDRGWSSGMKGALTVYKQENIPFEIRSLDEPAV